ncbi:MAG: aldose epimerase family protein [Mariniphaga sp.]|nr:galactose mutarotase [Mariniphaga sp.]MDD4225254.1 galactose mutarotase [Mariniphaga sp.]MDD4424563.1 galactose mutarotase [Mariniphaga sp.]
MSIKIENFGKLPDGRVVHLYTLTNKNNLEIKISSYGVNITCISMPDRHGNFENIVCGFDNLEDYLSENYLAGYPYFGCILGRYANRIANGHLEIEGKTYELVVNNGPNHLHGGSVGFDRQLWDAKHSCRDGYSQIEFSYLSPHLEENYPGNLRVKCICTVTDDNELRIEYLAETDQTTVINLSNHTYFNLTGGKRNILNHELKLAAKQITESVDLIPTGKLIPVKGTVYGFSRFKKLAGGLSQLPTGYDTNFVLDNPEGKLIYAGTLREKISGRMVVVHTTQPAIQLYTGYYIPELTIQGEKKFGSYSGVALETQHYPDSVHHPDFPSTLLKPGETFQETTTYKFSLDL